MSKIIQEEETKAKHSRTIVVGDFNMNPYEPGMVMSTGLHGVMSRADALRGSRKVQGREYSFFYNPMWNHLGDDLRPTAGTYYFAAATHLSYFWNTFDQVLIRPALIPGFKMERLQIPVMVGGVPLVKADGRPDKTNFSDHLPLVFEIEF